MDAGEREACLDDAAVRRFEKFTGQIACDTRSRCWLWTGKVNHFGYGRFQSGRRGVNVSSTAHRYAWRIFRGEIPVGLCVLHRCDIPACVNPDHLYLGTKADNMRDMAARSRGCTIGKSRLSKCPNGHPYTIESTHLRSNGQRRCRICLSARNKRAVVNGPARCWVRQSRADEYVATPCNEYRCMGNCGARRGEQCRAYVREALRRKG